MKGEVSGKETGKGHRVSDQEGRDTKHAVVLMGVVSRAAGDVGT